MTSIDADVAGSSGLSLPDDEPVLVIDLAMVRAKLDQFRRWLPGCGVHFAVKSNPSSELLAEIARNGAGFEVASIYELEDLADLGVDPAGVLFSNPVKPGGHIRRAHQMGTWRFAVDSVEEVAKVADNAPGASVIVRLRVDDSGSMFPLSRKYGVEMTVAERIMVEARRRGLDPYGITFHVGSQSAKLPVWREALHRCAAVMRMLENNGIRIRLIDIGGGFPVSYGEDVPTLAEIGEEVRAGLDRLPYRPEEVVCEPGRALVAAAGTIVAHVIGIRDHAGERWVHLDLGGYGGLFEAVETAGRWKFPVSALTADGPPRRVVLTGPTCDSSDTIDYGAVLPDDLAEGDTVCIGMAGAYSVSFATRFNGFPLLKAVAVDSRQMAADQAGRSSRRT